MEKVYILLVTLFLFSEASAQPKLIKSYDNIGSIITSKNNLYFHTKGCINKLLNNSSIPHCIQGVDELDHIPAWGIFNSVLYYNNEDGELFKLENDDHRTLIKDFDGYVHSMVSTEKNLFLATGNSIWKSDGTINGTTLIKAMDTGSVHRLLVCRNKVYFTVLNELWVSDGSETGTIKLKSFPDGFGMHTDGFNVFLEVGNEIWRTDGTELGTTKEIYFPSGSSLGNGESILKYNGEIVFSTKDSINEIAIWKTNGTIESTKKIKTLSTTGTYPELF